MPAPTMSRARSLALSAVLIACSSERGAAPPSEADAGASTSTSDAGATTPDIELYAVVDLPRTEDTQALSATAFEPATRTLYALQDFQPRVVPLVASEDYKTFTSGSPIALTGRTEAAWDGEGLALAADGFVAVTVETSATVERFDASGARTGDVPVPARFADQAPGNKGLESLALSPSGRFLFTANESALAGDGPAASRTAGTTVRVLRRDLGSGAEAQYAYRTEPLGAGETRGDMGVSEIAALSDDALLVLERGYQPDYGNTVRIFRVDLSGGTPVAPTAPLDDTTSILDKTLLIDLATLPSDGVAHPGPQPNPLLDNYEALTVGPTLPDGRRLLFVTSDDNRNAGQIPRILVLAARL